MLFARRSIKRLPGQSTDSPSVQGSDQVLREVWFGKVWRANAVRIVEETAALAVLHSPPGAPARYPVDDAGREVRIPRPDGWTLAERTAAGSSRARFALVASTTSASRPKSTGK